MNQKRVNREPEPEMRLACPGLFSRLEAMMGRPSSYTPEMAEMICDRLMEGESLRAICSEDAMPSQRVIYKWLLVQPEFVQQYARAREVQAHIYAEETREIVDTDPDPARA